MLESIKQEREEEWEDIIIVMDHNMWGDGKEEERMGQGYCC